MTSIKTEVTDVIQELTRNRKLFTAYDVTCILRDRCDGDKISHSDVKQEVHAVYDNDQMGIYERTQVNVGTKVSPFVYHLTHQDPNTDYDKDWVDSYLRTNLGVNPLTGQPTASVSPVSVSAVRKAQTPIPPNTSKTPQVVNSNKVVSRVATLKDGFKTFGTTKEGRLNIPKSLLKDFGDTIYVSISKIPKDGYNVDALSITDQPTHHDIRSYNINADGRLRISPRILRHAGISPKYAVKDASASLGRTILFVVAD